MIKRVYEPCSVCKGSGQVDCPDCVTVPGGYGGQQCDKECPDCPSCGGTGKGELKELVEGDGWGLMGNSTRNG